MYVVLFSFWLRKQERQRHLQVRGSKSTWKDKSQLVLQIRRVSKSSAKIWKSTNVYYLSLSNRGRLLAPHSHIFFNKNKLINKYLAGYTKYTKYLKICWDPYGINPRYPRISGKRKQASNHKMANVKLGNSINHRSYWLPKYKVGESITTKSKRIEDHISYTDIFDMDVCGYDKKAAVYEHIWYGHTILCHPSVKESIQILYWEEISWVSLWIKEVGADEEYKRKGLKIDAHTQLQGNILACLNLSLIKVLYFLSLQ